MWDGYLAAGTHRGWQVNYVVDSSAFEHSSRTTTVEHLMAQTISAVAQTRASIAVYRTPQGLHYPVVVYDPAAAAHCGKWDERLHALLPPIYPEWLGDRSFIETHGARFAYVAGEMARGIASAEMVTAAVRAGFVGFFGSGGLRLPTIAAALSKISDALGPDAPAWGANLIHNPDQPSIERATVELFLKQRVSRVSASAFMRLSPDIVHYSAAGLARDAQGSVVRNTHVFAKISRAEVAKQFMMPMPADMLRALAASGRITAEQADLARLVPVAEDITVEGDSGGHTDGRPISALFPVIAHLRDEFATRYAYARPVRLGLAGGIGTPSAVASAFQQGAAYVVVGSVNQSALESGVSIEARTMLAQAEVTDVMMAPTSDMFEIGAKEQVLKRGTMFAVKAQKLYELYRRHDSIDALPAKERGWLESQVFRDSIESAWARCRDHLVKSNSSQLEQVDRDPKQRMALLFRSYLFFGGQWAREGVEARRVDYRIWCGPAMGAFNDWVRGTFLELLGNRSVAAIGYNLLDGASCVTRAHQLRTAGVHVPGEFFAFLPRQQI
jgi:PfaD family protein